MGTFDVAQICLNGHVITSMVISHPEYKEEYCSECGETTITSCRVCNSNIKGYHTIPGVLDFSKYQKPKYCENCGKPFPWTERKIKAAKELIELADNLDVNEKDEMKGSIDELVKGGPQTVVAQMKYKRYLGRVGSEVAMGVKDILVDLVSETVKKAIWR